MKIQTDNSLKEPLINITMLLLLGAVLYMVDASTTTVLVISLVISIAMAIDAGLNLYRLKQGDADER